jgi:hypothetical protein
LAIKNIYTQNHNVLYGTGNRIMTKQEILYAVSGFTRDLRLWSFNLVLQQNLPKFHQRFLKQNKLIVNQL